MALHIVDGLPGAGKNVYIGKLALEYKKRGYDIAGNFPMKIAGFHLFHNMEQITQLRNTVVFIDEGQTYFDARNYQNMPREIIEVLRYNRKRKLEIYVIVQHFTRIDLNFRLLAADFIRVSRVFGSLRDRKTGNYGRPYGLSIAREYYLEDLPDRGEPEEASRFTSWIWIRDRYTKSLYETDYEIPFSEPWPWRHDCKPACRECGYQGPVRHV